MVADGLWLVKLDDWHLAMGSVGCMVADKSYGLLMLNGSVTGRRWDPERLPADLPEIGLQPGSQGIGHGGGGAMLPLVSDPTNAKMMIND